MENGTPKPGETANPQAPENGTPTQAPTQGNASDTAVEQIRKEKEQAEMRANQLANQLKAREEADAKAEAEKLEEQNQFKELYEQEKAKREQIEGEREAEERRKEVEKAKASTLTDYSDEVKTLAEEAGITLTSADGAEVTAYKERLDKIQNALGRTGKVGANNPGRPSSQPQLSQDQMRAALKDEKKFEELVKDRPGIAAMMSTRR